MKGKGSHLIKEKEAQGVAGGDWGKRDWGKRRTSFWRGDVRGKSQPKPFNGIQRVGGTEAQ